MNCFTISYLLGSGNVRSGDFSSHQNSHRGRQAAVIWGGYAQPHTALSVCSGFPWKTHLSPISPPSSFGSHSTCAHSPPGESHSFQPKIYHAPNTAAHYQGAGMIGEGRVGCRRRGCSLGADRKPIFFVIRCVMLQSERGVTKTKINSE